MLTAAWLHQLITATALLYMSNTLGNTPDRLIVCSAVLHDMFTSLESAEGQLPLCRPMRLYLASQVVGIGLELHELGSEIQAGSACGLRSAYRAARTYLMINCLCDGTR